MMGIENYHLTNIKCFRHESMREVSVQVTFWKHLNVVSMRNRQNLA